MCELASSASLGKGLIYSIKVMPTAISTGGDIGLSNLSLKTITLSLYSTCSTKLARVKQLISSNVQILDPHLRPHRGIRIQARILLTPLDSSHLPDIIRCLPDVVRHDHGRYPRDHHGVLSLCPIRFKMGVNGNGHAQEINGIIESFRYYFLVGPFDGCCTRRRERGIGRVE